VPDDFVSRTGYVSIGKIVGCHGIRGVVKLLPFTESPAFFTEGSRLLLACPAGGEKTVRIKWARPHKKMLLLCLEGTDSRTQAERLDRCEVLISRERLEEPEEGSWYWVDLMGLTVEDTRLGPLGTLKSIFRTGSNDVYVVADEKREILIPALASVVLSVDLTAGRMEVRLPEGLL